MRKGQIVRIRDSEGFDGQYGVVLTEGTARLNVKFLDGTIHGFSTSQLVTQEAAGANWSPPREIQNLSREMETAAA